MEKGSTRSVGTRDLSRWASKSWLLAFCVGVAACAPPRDASTRSQSEAPPVDTTRIAAGDAVSWRHFRVAHADLNADGTPERLVIAADVELSAADQPLWEDGHRWALFVNDTPQVTLLYGAFVPNGHVEAAVLSSGADGRRPVLVQERTPSGTRVLVIAYEGPGVARTVSAARYDIEIWLPGLANP